MDKNSQKNPLILSLVYKFTHSIAFQTQGIDFICPLKSTSVISYANCSKEIKPGDLILLPPSVDVILNTSDSAVFLRTSINYSYFIKNFPLSFSRLLCDSTLYPGMDYKPLLSLLAWFPLIAGQTGSESNFKLMSTLFKLFELLKSSYLDQSLSNLSGGKQEKKADAIKDYLQKKYDQPITLLDVASHLNITPQYLANFIKKQFGKTFFELLSEIRFEHALVQLEFTEDSILKIAVDNGYPNLSALNKNFKEILNTAPELHRLKTHKALTDKAAGDFLIIHNTSLLKEYLSDSLLLNSEEQMNAALETEQHSIQCDVKKSTPLISTWNNLINLGFAQNFDKPDFRQQLQDFQAKLQFKFGRIQGIFELINSYQMGERIDYDLRRVFNVIDFMRAINLKPHFEIGNKSINLYKASLMESAQGSDESDTHEKYLNQYLPVFLNHCINRYGLEVVSTWRFELWRQYNNTLSVFEDPIRYLKRFRYVYQTIKKHLPNAQVGGPGHNTFADIGQLKRVLDEFKNQNLEPDFVSAFVYPYEKVQGDQVILSLKHNIYRIRINEIIELLQELKFNSPCFVTEYSSFMSGWNCFNDSNYQASFIIKESLENSKMLGALGYWIFSDTSFEYKNATGILFGGNGLISRDGIKKPGYYAFKFLKTLGGNLLAKGEHFIITSSSERNLQILLFNYCYFTEHYCTNHLQYQLLQYPYSAFKDELPKSFDINLEGLPKGKYRVREHILNQEYGSLLNEWQKMQEIPDLSKSEIDYLKHVSIPHIRVNFEDVSDKLSISALLYSNDITLIEIDYYL